MDENDLLYVNNDKNIEAQLRDYNIQNKLADTALIINVGC